MVLSLREHSSKQDKESAARSYTPAMLVWRTLPWRLGPREYRGRHPSRERGDPCRRRLIWRDLRKRTRLWPVADAPWVRSDRSARFPDDPGFFETQPLPRGNGPSENKR